MQNRTQQEQPATPAPCTTHSWCTERGDHDLHLSGWTVAPHGAEILDATILAADTDVLAGEPGTPPVIGFLGLDLTPEQTRDHVGALLHHLCAVLDLAGRLERIEREAAAAQDYAGSSRAAAVSRPTSVREG